MSNIKRIKGKVRNEFLKYYDGASDKTRKYIRKADKLKVKAVPIYHKSVQEGRKYLKSKWVGKRKEFKSKFKFKRS